MNEGIDRKGELLAAGLADVGTEVPARTKKKVAGKLISPGSTTNQQKTTQYN